MRVYGLWTIDYGLAAICRQSSVLTLLQWHKWSDMMAAQKTTPEEKLFAVIQGAKTKHPRAKTQAISLAGLAAQIKTHLGSFDLPRVNRILGIVVVVMVMLCLINPLFMKPSINGVMAQAQEQLAPFVIPPPLEGLKPSAQYVETMLIKDPFRVGELPLVPPQVGESEPVQPSLDAQAFLSDVRLVGISWDEEPVAMIEQKTSQQTHFLKSGDMLGTFTIKEILEDRVILQHGSQEVELF